MTFEKVVQRPLDAVIHPLKLTGSLVGVLELQQTPGQDDGRIGHGVVEFDVVTGCTQQEHM